MLLGLSRSSLYYKASPSRQQADDDLGQTLQSLHQSYPAAGSRVLREKLMEQGIHIGRRRVRNLMKKLQTFEQTDS